MTIFICDFFIRYATVDDAAAIAFALSMASLYIDEGVNEKARKKLVEFMAQVVS